MSEGQEARIVLTDSARDVLERVRAERSGALSLVIGNGCCDSTAPYLFVDHLPGPSERLAGHVEGVPVFVDDLVARSLDGTEVVVDAREGADPDSFSCEAELGYRLVLDRLPGVSGDDSSYS